MDSPVAAVAISADGRRAVSGGHDGTVRVWDLDTGQQQAKLSGHDGPVAAVAISADGRRAVSGGHDGTVRAWDLDTGEPLRTLGRPRGPGARGGDQRRRPPRCLRRRRWDGAGWDLEEGVEFALFASDSTITELAVTSAGTRVIAGPQPDRYISLSCADTNTPAASSLRRSRTITEGPGAVRRPT